MDGDRKKLIFGLVTRPTLPKKREMQKKKRHEPMFKKTKKRDANQVQKRDANQGLDHPLRFGGDCSRDV